MLFPSLVLFSYFLFKMIQNDSHFYLCCLYCVVVSFSALSWHSSERYMRTVPGCIQDPQLDGEFFLATHRHCVLDPIVSRNPLSREMINYDKNIKVPFHFHCNWSLDQYILGFLEELDLHSCYAWCTFVKLGQSTFLEFDFTFPRPCCWRHIFWKSQ